MSHPADLRPLPEKPNLEFERKRAKQLLARIRDGDADALTQVRAQLPGRRQSATPDTLTLADTQLAAAREYGFLSWPRLVSYFEMWDRHERTGPMFGSAHSRDHVEMHVREKLRWYRTRRMHTQVLATFVPRLHGLSDADIQASTVSEDEARHAVARTYRFSTWEALLAWVTTKREMNAGVKDTPSARAFQALRTGDFESLGAILQEHPELLVASSPGHRSFFGGSLLDGALQNELKARTPAARATTDWLVSRGGEWLPAVSAMLIPRFMHMRTDDVAYLLERGADPNWLPPNGIPLLEHALMRYWNPEAVDLLAKRVVPRKAFWIAAGVGDVSAVRGYIDRNGKLRAAARRHRPDFTALFLGSTPCSPEASDQDILWEAFFVAGLNHRLDVIDVFLDSGFPIDAAPWGATLLHFTVGNRFLPVVEHLVKRGASLEIRNQDPTPTSARDYALMLYQQEPSDPVNQRLMELCGGAP